MKFKIYKKKYESYYANYGRYQMKSYENTYAREFYYFQVSDLKNEDYYTAIKREMLLFQKSMWEFAVKYSWLKKKFRMRRSSGAISDVHTGRDSYGFYVMLFHKFNFSNMFFRRWVVRSVSRIAEATIKNFSGDNPFLNFKKYRYPFKFISLDYIHFVKFLDIEMAVGCLYYADKKKMPFGEFCDFVYNQCLCYNDENNYELYLFVKGPSPYFFPACQKGAENGKQKVKTFTRDVLAELLQERINIGLPMTKRIKELPPSVRKRLTTIVNREKFNDNVKELGTEEVSLFDIE